MTKIRLPGKIIFKDDMGKILEIRAPSLISLFFSDKLKKSFDKDPEKEYSIKDLLHMANPKCSESTIRANLKIHIKLFETDDTIKMTKQGLMSIKVARLKPVCDKIFDAVRELEDD
jgi:hypothetical protein